MTHEKRWDLPTTQPAIVQSKDGEIITVWMQTMSVSEKYHAPGVFRVDYEAGQSILLPDSRIESRGRFIVRDGTFDIHNRSSFSITISAGNGKLIKIEDCYIDSASASVIKECYIDLASASVQEYNQPILIEVDWRGGPAKVFEGEITNLILSSPPDEIELVHIPGIPREPPRKKVLNHPRTRSAKVLAVAKRKRHARGSIQPDETGEGTDYSPEGERD